VPEYDVTISVRIIGDSEQDALDKLSRQVPASYRVKDITKVYNDDGECERVKGITKVCGDGDE
jgi:hypothetical protein